ncbi:sensor histidine kinase [Streptomyces kaempferi]
MDRGPGIPPSDRDRLFEPFQRLGDTDNSTGLGLGLALSRGLTEAMDGTLVPEDTPGGGLTMVLSLPCARDAQDAQEARDGVPRRWCRRRGVGRCRRRCPGRAGCAVSGGAVARCPAARPGAPIPARGRPAGRRGPPRSAATARS